MLPKFWRTIWTKADKTVSKCASSALFLRYRNDFSQELHYAYKTKYLSKWLFHLWFCLSMSISVKNLDSYAYKASPIISHTRDSVTNSISSTWNVHKLIYLTRQGAHIPAHSVGPRRLVYKKSKNCNLDFLMGIGYIVLQMVTSWIPLLQIPKRYKWTMIDAGTSHH